MRLGEADGNICLAFSLPTYRLKISTLLENLIKKKPLVDKSSGRASMTYVKHL